MSSHDKCTMPICLLSTIDDYFTSAEHDMHEDDDTCESGNGAHHIDRITHSDFRYICPTPPREKDTIVIPLTLESSVEMKTAKSHKKRTEAA